MKRTSSITTTHSVMHVYVIGLYEFFNYILACTQPDPQLAQQVLSADIGKSDAAVVVQHLTQLFYAGQLSLQVAYFKADNSGISE